MKELFEKISNKTRKKAVRTLAGIVAFATAYSLILPAITIDQETAEGEPGIVLNESEETQEMAAYEEPETVEEEAPQEEIPVIEETKEENPEPAEEAVNEEQPQEMTETVTEETKPAEVAEEKPAEPAKQEEPAEIILEATAGKLEYISEKDYKITIEYTEDAGFAEGTELEIRETLKEDEYANTLQKAQKELEDDETITQARFFETAYKTENEEYKTAEGKTIVTYEPEKMETEENQEIRVLTLNKENRYEEIDEKKLSAKEKENKVEEIRFETEDLDDFTILVIEKEQEEITETPEILTEEKQEHEETVTEEISMPAVSFTKTAGDVTVTVDAPEGAFPEGTEMEIELVDEAPYMDAINSTINEDETVKTAQAVDIRFIYNDEEIEPQKEIKVNLISSVIRQTEDPKLIHIDNEGSASIVDATQDTKTYSEEINNPDKTETVESLTFTSDAFSVYVIVGTETISEQYIDIHGDTYKVTVTYSEDAKIPKDAKLSVTEILEGSAEYQEFYSKAAEAVLDGQEKAVPFARFFDISIMDGEEEIQPQAPVDVKIEFIGNVEIQSGARFNAVHFAENSIDVMDASVQLAAEENHAVEAVSFEAEGFSVYGVTYTVDFTYKNYTFSIPGESSILLSELFEILGIEADVAEVTSVEFTDDDLIRIEQLESDWLLTSLKAFDTDELLTVTTKSGIVYRIDVQDEQDVTFPESIKGPNGDRYYKQGDVQSVTATYVLTGQGQTQILNTLGLYNTPISTDEIYCTLYYQAYKHSKYNEVYYLLEIRALDEILTGSGYSIDNSSLWDIYTPSGNNDIDNSTLRYPQSGNPATSQSTKALAYLKNNSSTHRRALALVTVRPSSGQYNYQLFGSGTSGLQVYKVIEVTYTDGEAAGQSFAPDQVYTQRSLINGSTGNWSDVNMPAFVAADGTNTPSWTDHTFTGWKVTASEDPNIPVGTVYTAGTLPATVHNNVTFEAQWSSHSDKKVTVSKIVEPGTGVKADEIDQTIYIALYDQSSGTYLTDGDGHILYKEIVITDGVPEPVSVEFDGLSNTVYSVREFVEVDGEKVNALHSTFVADGNLIELSGITGYNTDESGNRITGSDNDADMANADNAWVVFENTYTTEDEPRTLTVSKRWMKNGADITDSITEATATFTLYRSIPDGEDTAVTSVTLDGSVDEPEEGVTDGEFTAWAATFSDYPARDDSGNKYTYKVRETACTPEDYLPYANPGSESPMTEEEYKADQGTIYNKYQKTSITVKKEDDKNNFIPGAVFELYQVVTDDSDASHDVLIQELTVNEEAGYSIPDLISGDYKLREKSAPGGYVIIDSPIEFHVDAIGNSVITWPDGTKPDNVKNLTTTNVQNDTFTVINKQGHELPSTGGSGTLLYTLSGLALMLGAALMYGFRMRRRERRCN